MAQQPSEKQIRMMHVVNLMSIAYADGNISEEENDILVRIAQDLGLSEEEFGLCVEHWKQTDEDKLPIAVPETDDEQVEFMKHFALVMMMDGEIEENEKAMLNYVVDQFGYYPDKIVPALIEDVYQEYFAEEEEEEDDEDDEEEEDDELFGDTDDEMQLDLGKMKLEGKHVEEAFDYLFLPALRNQEACAYFLIIPNTATRLFRLTPEQLDKVQQAAERGFPLAYYVLGRYHQVVKPADNSIEIAIQCLTKAVEGGIPDAQWALAVCYLYGYLGDVDMDEFNGLVKQAFDNGSMMAFKQMLHDIIHGDHGNKADPKKAIKVIDGFLKESEEHEAMHPDMYDLLGDAYRKVGNKDKADKCYEKASDLGYMESEAHRFENRVEGPDKDFYRETLSLLLDYGCEENDPNSFLARALEHAYHYDIEKKAEKKESWAEKLREDLGTAYKLGLGDAAYYLGLYSYTGKYGFKKDPQQAWTWFSKGRDLESALAFMGTAQMVADGVHPADIPDDFIEYCHLAARLRGYSEDDQESASAGEIPTVFIVKPDGKATIYKLEKEEWYKLAHLVGSKRLAPVRLDTLDKLAKKNGSDDHLVAWIDIDAPRKGLATNTVAASFFQGVIAGDVVFSLADGLYEPVPFYGIDEAKSFIEVLKAKFDTVVTDISKVSDDKQRKFDYSKVNPLVNKGYVARVEQDGKAHIVDISLAVFALSEEEIYDPVRLDSLRELGKKMGLKGQLTIWTDNSALRKQMVMDNKITPNPVAKKIYPGPVADSFFIAMEDENYRVMLFDDPGQLRDVCAALNCKM